MRLGCGSAVISPGASHDASLRDLQEWEWIARTSTSSPVWGTYLAAMVSPGRCQSAPARGTSSTWEAVSTQVPVKLSACPVGAGRVSA